MNLGSIPDAPSAAVTLSVVSHGQIGLVNQLLQDLAADVAPGLRVILTRNIAEAEPIVPPGWRHHLVVIDNRSPRGFGANHNAAFRRSATEVFCVVNPDIRLRGDPLPPLLAALEQPGLALVGPRVCGPDGRVEDSARKFPTLGRLLFKALAGAAGPDYPLDRGVIEVDWVAGMFMAIRREAFAAVDGFDERFFLYYEDVDLCRRLRSKGYAVAFNPATVVVHDARRASRRDPRLMRIHAASALRYLLRKYP